ncbi:hypothetical protein KEG38_23565 [Polyangium jinanense]|nr:hypothetical protein [Polyangium jinanense]MDC3956858.1 hypothetical protein [Polyangium jinanense]
MNCPIGSSEVSWQIAITRTPRLRSASLSARAWATLRMKRDVWYTSTACTSAEGVSTSSIILRKAFRFASVPVAPGSMYSWTILKPRSAQ